MSVRPVWRRLMPGNLSAGAIGFCLVFTLDLSLGRSLALGSPAVTGMATPGNSAMQRIAGGGEHSLAIKPDGSLWAWGYGVLGDGTRAERHTPVQVLTGVAAVTAGGQHTLAIKTDGSLWAWGWNNFGELGDGTTTTRVSPVQVLTEVEAVAAGSALKTDGTLWTWGFNLGDGTTTNRLSPVQVLTGVVAVTGGGNHTLALKTGGSLWAWGNNGSGQLGDGTTTDRLSPVPVLTGVAAVTAGLSHTLALKTDGTLWAWGNNEFGHLGDGTSTNRLSPLQVLTGVVAVAGGGSHTLAIKTDGSLWAWGYNEFGQLGDGTTTNRLSPVPVLTGVAGVTAGWSHTLALKTDGSLWTWGSNYFGQIGDGTTTNRLSPFQLSGFGVLSDFVVTRVVLTPSSPTANGTFSAAVTVKNQGLVSGDGGDLDIWANQPTTRTCWETGTAYAGVGTIVAGAEKTLTFPGLRAGAAGTKTLRAFVDSQCLTTELDDTNNQSTTPYTVLASPAPDFAVTSVILTPSGPITKGTFSVAVTVKNQGSVAGTPGALQLWLNLPDVQGCSAVGDKSATLASLAAGASRTVTLTGLSAGVAGAKTLRAFVDSQCQTAEPNESDNQSTAAYTVFSGPTPDFVVTGVVLTPGAPKANRTFSAAVTVKNQGSGSGNGGYLDVWSNQPNDQDCQSDGDVYANVGTLAAGASKTLTLSGLRSAAQGTKTLRAFVDSYCQTRESYEGNNQAVKGYTVVP